MTQKERKIVVLLSAVSALNLILRCMPFNWVFKDEGIILVDGDSYYHMRRILLAVTDFAHIPSFDSYMNFPDGARIPWPPLYDLFVALVAMVAGLVSPSIRLTETVAAFVPPVLGALTVFPLFFLVRRLFDERTGLLAALFFSLVPGHIQYTYLGRPDHHAAEPLMLVLFTLCFSVAVQESNNTRKRVIYALLAGVVLSAGLLSWPGAIIYLGLVGLASGAVMLSNQHRGQGSGPYFLPLSLSAATTFIILTFYLIATGNWRPFDYMYLSGFHATLMLYALVFFLCLWVLSGWMIKKGVNWVYILPGALIILVLVSALFFVAVPNFYASIHDGVFKQIGRSVPWRMTISESRPLFSVMTRSGYEFSVDNAASRAGWAVFLVPFGYWMLSKRRENRDGVLFFVTWSLPLMFLALHQMRYLYYFAMPMGVLTAQIAERALSPGKKQNKIVRTALVVLFFAAIFSGTLSNAVDLFKGRERDDVLNHWGMDSVRTMKWIKGNTPEPGVPPSYGIMSTWGFGHEITYIAGRPVVANNFAGVLGGRGFPASLDFFTTDSVDKSMEILSAHKCRYIFITAPTYYCAMAARMRGDSPGRFYDENWEPLKAAKDIVVYRMYFNDARGIPQYRLVYESELPAYGSEDLKKFKVYEFVKGARLRGLVAGAGSKVSASARIITNRGRVFTYESSVAAGPGGTFELTLPYATAGEGSSLSDRTYAQAHYKVEVNGQYKGQIEITEDEIQYGRTKHFR